MSLEQDLGQHFLCVLHLLLYSNNIRILSQHFLWGVWLGGCGHQGVQEGLRVLLEVECGLLSVEDEGVSCCLDSRQSSLEGGGKEEDREGGKEGRREEESEGGVDMERISLLSSMTIIHHSPSTLPFCLSIHS